MKQNLYVIKIQRNRVEGEEFIVTTINDTPHTSISKRTDTLKDVLKLIKEEVVIVAGNRRAG